MRAQKLNKGNNEVEKHIHRWKGYIHCEVCGDFYLFGKCRDCDIIRIETCPVDGSKLEFIEFSKELEKTS